MIYCENCGAELREDQRFCPHCGKEREAPPRKEQRDFWAERLAHPMEPEEKRTPENTEKPESPAKQEEKNPVPEEFLEILEPARKPGPRWPWFAGAAILVLTLAAVCFFWLRAGNTETYYGKACTLGDRIYSAEGDYIRLRSGGGAEICLLDRHSRGRWEIIDNRMVITWGQDRLEGKLRQGVLTLEQGDYHFVLAKKGIPWSQDQTRELLEKDREPVLWQGDYYGWWQVTECWGGFDGYQGQRLDACGRIELEPDGQGRAEFWDTECLPGQLFCAAEIRIDPGLTDRGSLQCLGGRFMDLTMEPGHWSMDPGAEPYGELQDMLILQGTLNDGEDGFSYIMVLRPWGRDWEDADSLRCPLLPVSNRLPQSYKTWYLPQIQREEPMPATMQGVHEGQKSESSH